MVSFRTNYLFIMMNDSIVLKYKTLLHNWSSFTLDYFVLSSKFLIFLDILVSRILSNTAGMRADCKMSAPASRKMIANLNRFLSAELYVSSCLIKFNSFSQTFIKNSFTKNWFTNNGTVLSLSKTTASQNLVYWKCL